MHDTSSPGGALPNLLSSSWLLLTHTLSATHNCPLSRTTYRKSCLRAFSILKWKYLAHVVEWAYAMGCSNDHKLIANCLDFLDIEVHISSIHLGPKNLYYLPSLFHFWENKAKTPSDPSRNDKEGLNRVDKFLSPHNLSSMMASQSEVDGSLRSLQACTSLIVVSII